MNDEKTCLLCDYYNDGACACPSINKWTRADSNK